MFCQRNRTFGSINASCSLARHLGPFLVLSRDFVADPVNVYKEDFCFTINLEQED